MVKARPRDGGRAFLVSSSIVAGLGKLSATGRQGVGDRAAGWRYRPICGSGSGGIYPDMIRKLKSGEYRLYSRKKDASTGKRRNLGTFSSLEKAKQHEREVQYFKKH